MKNPLLLIKLFVDTLAYTLATTTAIFTYNINLTGFSQSYFHPVPSFLITGYLVYILLIYTAGGYEQHREFTRLSDLTAVIGGSFQALLIYLAFLFLLKIDFPRLLYLKVSLLLPVTSILSRVFADRVINRYLPELIQDKVLVYGAGSIGKSFVESLEKNKLSHLNIVGFVDDHETAKLSVANPLPILGTYQDLEHLVKKYDVDRLIIAIRELPRNKLHDIRSKCENLGIRFSFIPSPRLFSSNPFKLRDFAGITLASANSNSESPLYRISKRFFDILLASIGLILFAPFALVIAFLIKKEDGGPVLFKHKRVGLNGHQFTMYKFRSMRVDTEKYAHCPVSSDDPRITRIGKWLRKWSIDEVPQLINVIKGEMSIVGPRPEMPFIVEKYNDFERQRLVVKPGITGLWQISPGRKTEITDNIEYDLYYVENRSITLDFIIMVMTIFFIFRGFTH
jgi:exopolysaccharide biosynthesis polyprenyl glycosylphosphotransferase